MKLYYIYYIYHNHSVCKVFVVHVYIGNNFDQQLWYLPVYIILAPRDDKRSASSDTSDDKES